MTDIQDEHTHIPDQVCTQCGHAGKLYIHGRCHPDSPLSATVEKDVLTITCFTCEKVIVKFVVASPLKMQLDRRKTLKMAQEAKEKLETRQVPEEVRNCIEILINLASGEAVLTEPE